MAPPELAVKVFAGLAGFPNFGLGSVDLPAPQVFVRLTLIHQTLAQIAARFSFPLQAAVRSGFLPQLAEWADDAKANWGEG